MIFELTEHGVAHARFSMLSMSRRARDARPAFERIASEVIAGEKVLFASRNVRPLAPSTVERKLRDRNPRVRSNARRARVGTGLLRSTLTSRGPAARAHGQILEIDRDGLRFGIRGGSAVGYGILSQTGDSRQPRRQVIKLSRAARLHAKSILRDHIVG